MEGSRGVKRALADNGQPASVGRSELNNKTSSCLSFVAEQTHEQFLFLLLLHAICKSEVKFFCFCFLYRVLMHGMCPKVFVIVCSDLLPSHAT